MHTCGIREDNGKAECWGVSNGGSSVTTPPAGVRFLPCGIQGADEAVCSGDSLLTQSFEIPEGGERGFRVVFSSDVTADEDISVDWSVSCDGDVSGEDFVGGCPSGTVTIAAGSDFARFTISTNDDMVLESDEDFTVSLIKASPSIEGLITISPTRDSITATITDDGTVDIGFEELTYDVSEDVGSVTLTVSVLSGEINEGVVVTVVVTTIDGSAVAGEDYTEVIRTLVFSSAVRTQTLSVSILEDAVLEGTEEFVLALSGESISSDAPRAEVSIRDGDNNRGVITFRAVSSRVDEGGVAIFMTELTGDVTVDEAIFVEWRVSCDGGMGVSDEDFVGGCPTGTATIAAGQTSTIFTIMTDMDSVVENDEELPVSITGCI